MLLQLPPSTRFPVTITQIHFSQNAEVKKLQAIFTFSYKSLITEDNDDGEEIQRLTDIISKFETPVGGKIIRWMVGKGSVVSSPSTNIVEIEEPCPHPVVWNNQCAVCGADLSEQTYINYHNPETANINVTHDNTGLKISRGEAENIEKEAKKRLLSSKKLSLVVDLDQTIIQATVDPTVGEWRDDSSNPNYDAVKDVEAFQLLDEGAGGRGCWYYVKLRPGLKRFLENISKIYECHIYTMGTRAYAMSIAKIVDPLGDIFGERILSRDESGSLTSKSLERLFPVDTKMVVIIDDRGDVWKWSDNLIKVTPYDFFVGIGDINSSFLPKRHDYQLAQQAAQQAAATNHVPKSDDPPVINPEQLTAPVAAIPVENGTEDTQMSDPVEEKKKEETENTEEVSPLEQLVEMGGGDDPDVLAEQTSRQNEALTAQQKERPLAKKQEVLDKQDSDSISNHSNNGDTNSDSGHRHNLLHDNDNELEYLEMALTEVHQEFFEEYQRRLVASKGGRVAQVRGGGGKGGKRAPRGNSEGDSKADYLKNVPDIKHIMPRMKRRVFDNTVLVFSGVIPLGVDVQSSDIAQWAKSFGAIVVDGVSVNVTHVVAARTRTAKVRSAATKFPHIKIVTPQWFFQSIAMWQKLDETPFLINVYPEDRFANSSPPLPSSSMGFDDLEDQMELSSDEEEDDDDGDSDINTLDGRPGVIPDLMLPEESEPPPDLHDLNWDEMDRDLADFMGSEADDTDLESRNGTDAYESDNESASGDQPHDAASLKVSLSNNKRDRSATPPPDGADEQARVAPVEPREPREKELLKSPLSKRVRLSNSRSSSLRNLTLSAEEPQIGESGMPSPAQSNGEQGGGSVRDEEEDDFDLEAEIENEFNEFSTAQRSRVGRDRRIGEMLPNIANVPERIAGTVRRLPVVTRVVVGVCVVLFLVGRVTELDAALVLSSPAFGISQLHRLNTYPFVHFGWLQVLINIVVVTYPLSRFERENGTLHTLLMVVGPFSTFPAIAYTAVDKLLLGGNGTYGGLSTFIVMFGAMDATRMHRYKPYYWVAGYRIPSWAPVVGVWLLLEIFVLGGVGWLIHLFAMAVGWAYAAEYLRLLEPPEKVLKFVETKLRALIARVPYYVSLDMRDSAGYTLVLPTFQDENTRGVDLPNLRMNPRNGAGGSSADAAAGNGNFGGVGRALGT
ncbi:hypothetical protein Dda_2608 [Drechslerella dactyloides]|uniref:protein-serine/threonine phosphatase n=1 Tax=Drechslerella dactyloides TaxID=74499 RepID=A0AAD6IZT9_DREDA|nr:hypothetical protein Dda_2608 [Drechslerella dactyloides]